MEYWFINMDEVYGLFGVYVEDVFNGCVLNKLLH